MSTVYDSMVGELIQLDTWLAQVYEPRAPWL